jgi:hypothetical protein
LRGILTASDEDGFTLDVEGSDDEPVRLAYSDVDTVRTVFVWGGIDGPGGSDQAKSGPKKPGGKKSADKQTAQQKTQKRKQVVTP